MNRRKWFSIVLLAGLLAVPTASSAAHAAHAAPAAAAAPSGVSSPSSAAQMADEIFALINQARVAAGVKPVTRNAILEQGAQQWTQYLAGNNCYTGRSPICHQPRTAMKALANAAAAPKTAKWWAENVMFMSSGDANKSHGKFMNSSGHRANILRKDTNAVGIGVVIREDGWVFVTHVFAQVPVPPPPPHPCGKVSGTFSYGARGTKVKVLQCALAGLGFYAGPVDGKFLSSTRAAVRAFQASRGLKVTGSANLVTRRAIGITPY